MEKLVCKYSKKCGNCPLIDKTYKETVNIKLNKINECLKREKIDYQISRVIEANNTTAYRNKMIIGFKSVNGKVISGFYEENSHNIVDIDNCLMHTDIQNKIATEIKKILISLKLRPYDEDRKIGLLRYILIRESFSTKEILITLVTSTDVFPARNEFVKRVRAISPNIKTIVQNINPRKTSIVLGDKERILFGKGYITDEMCGIKFNISSKAFYQVNAEQTKKLYGKVVEFANFKKTETIIDAYSGVGTIGMILSSNVKQVISVENNKQSVIAAIQNAKLNNINNVRFICDDATNFIVDFAKENQKIDALIMDPPRSGSTPAFLDAAVKLKPNKIVYVSCDPTTLSRDLKHLLKNGYKITNGIGVDMFCWTNHVETIILLAR